MNRDEIHNRILGLLKEQIAWLEANPNQRQNLQMSRIHDLIRVNEAPHGVQDRINSIAHEIMQELINSGFIYYGQPGSSSQFYPFITITEYGKEALLKEGWLPYDPAGYVKALQEKIPEIDDITLTYIGEAVATYNRRQLLSATITLGVASENLMLLLIEAYTEWIKDSTRKANFKKRVEGRFISTQYREFKKEFLIDIKDIPKEFQSDWETYLDAIFNFVRLNRNDAGHATGKKFDAKVVYANLQIFAEYAQFMTSLTVYFNK